MANVGKLQVKKSFVTLAQFIGQIWLHFDQSEIFCVLLQIIHLLTLIIDCRIQKYVHGCASNQSEYKENNENFLLGSFINFMLYSVVSKACFKPNTYSSRMWASSEVMLKFKKR
jgi:hypothetical protein